MPAQPNPMSAFNELENCFVKVCRDAERTPIQWIYSADDAWFHPVSFDLSAFNSVQSDGLKKAEQADLAGLLRKDTDGGERNRGIERRRIYFGISRNIHNQ